jgi:ATP-dependent helicase/DNAse subunit B
MLSLARLGKLRRVVDDILAQELAALAAGEIRALPLAQNAASEGPCGYCDYRAVCGREPGQAPKIGKNIKFEEALQMIDDWGNGDG